MPPVGASQVPLVWAATLAHHGSFMLNEGGLVLQVAAAWLEPLTHVAPDSVPGLAMHPAVVSFVQFSLLALGGTGSLVLLAMLSHGRGAKKPATADIGSWPHYAVVAAVAAALGVAVMN